MYIGYHKINGTRVVIKKIPKSKFKLAKKVNRILEDEAHNLCQNSKTILTFVESFQCKDNQYIVTKYAPGGHLLAAMKQDGVKRLPEPQTRSITLQIA